MQKRKGLSPIDLLEESVHLLRTAPSEILMCYYIGTLPFFLGFLYFWADMSASPFAARHVATASFTLTLAFIWMKCWQSIYASRLKARLAGESSSSQIPAQHFFRMIVVQTILQVYGFIVLPASMLVGAVGWAYAFYQNVLVYGNGETPLSEAARNSWDQAKLWPMQNHQVLSILALFGLFLFINVGSVMIMVPDLLKTLFGVETIFTRSGMGQLNSTFVAIGSCITFLCMDPLVKAMYVLRCFYGESIHSGADLKSELKKSVAAILVVLFLFLSTAPSLQADSTSVEPEKLNKAVQEEIAKREYQWRLPRQEKDAKKENGMFADFMEGVLDWLQKKWEAIWTMWKRLREWYRKHFQPVDPNTGLPVPGKFGEERMLLYALGAIVVLALGLFLWKLWRKRNKSDEVIPAAPVFVVPDLRDENLVANQLPEEEWQILANELLAKGEVRLALRALYMAALAHLGKGGLITIARYKSNREYQKELHRRARDREPIVEAFAGNVTLFERSWYGEHEVTPEVLSQFNQNQQILWSAF